MKALIKYGYDGGWCTVFTKEFLDMPAVTQIDHIELIINELSIKKKLVENYLYNLTSEVVK